MIPSVPGVVFPLPLARILPVAVALATGATVVGAADTPARAPVEWCDPASPLPPANDHFVQPESTRRMNALVQDIYRRADPLRNPFRSADQVPLLRAQLADPDRAPTERVNLKLQLAQQLLQAGFNDEAIAEYAGMEDFIRAQHLPPDEQLSPLILLGQAMGHLRAGELANCIRNHNADSCLFPIRGGGVHLDPAGSRAAVTVLTELLAKYRGDLRGRWLLNVAAMTLGDYPDKVPPQWLIEPKLLASDYALPRFPDIAAALGLDLDGFAGGEVVDDFDHDGLLDLMVSSQGFTAQDQLRVFRNLGDGRFEERTIQAGLEGLVGALNLIQGDFDNDGFVDVLMLRGGWLGAEGRYPVSLLRNNGDFTFTDVTAASGLLSHRAPTQSAVWFDFDGDGRLDLFLGNESTAASAVPCELFRNNGNGTFTECGAASGVAVTRFVKGAVTLDYNRDGRPDLFLSCRGGGPVLWRNDGPADPATGGAWKFTDVTDAAGLASQASTFTCWAWDYDNDGWEDLMMTGYLFQDVGDVAADVMGRPHPAQKARLYRNNGDGTFTDASKAAGVSKLLHAMGANFGDLDNDGWLDFYVGTGDPDLMTLIPSRMFRNDGGRRFQDVTTAGGFGQLQKGHAIAFADLNNDGPQEIFSKVGGAASSDHYESQVFFNPIHDNHWLKLQLEGVTSNRIALGARIHVVAVAQGRERSLYRTVGTGGSFGANPLRQEIGLGQAERIARVEIFWPATGATQVLTGFVPDRAYRIVEGEAAPRALALRTFTLPLTSSARVHQHVP